VADRILASSAASSTSLASFHYSDPKPFRDLIAEVFFNILLGNPEQTLAEYATIWLARLPLSGLKQRSIDSYQQLLNNHILPALGATKIRDLRRSQIKALLTDKYEATFQVQKKVRDETGKVVRFLSRASCHGTQCA
jgi:integrase-like protein